MNLSKRTIPTGIAALVASLAALATPLSASSAEATATTQSTAEANFTQVDATGCVLTQTIILAVDEASRTGPSASSSSWLYLSIGRYDTCVGQFLFGASHSGPLPAGAFQVSAGSHTAELDASIDAVELVTGTPLSLELHLGWVGGEVVQRDHSHGNEWSEWGMNAYVSGDSFRTAIASGTVTGGADHFTAGQATRAFIGAIREGSVQVAAQSSPFAAQAELLSLAASTTVSGYDQETIGAFSRTVDASGCVDTTLGVAVYDRRFLVTHGSPIRAATLAVNFVRYDLCTNSYVSSLFVEVPLSEEEFSIDGLRTGRVHAVVPAVDYFLGPLTLSIDLEFTGTGPTYRSIATGTSRTVGEFGAGHSSSVGRSAIVTGLVTDGTASITGPFDGFMGADRSTGIVHP